MTLLSLISSPGVKYTEGVTMTENNTPAAEAAEADVVVEDLLVEEVSIDGMCGVY
jgi:mycofactocin precursor